MPKYIKSVCSLVRRELKVKGRTQHDGQGSYEMFINDPNGELKDGDLLTRLEAAIVKWEKQGWIEVVERPVADVITVEFKKTVCYDPYYRKLVLAKNRMSVNFALFKQ